MGAGRSVRRRCWSTRNHASGIDVGDGLGTSSCEVCRRIGRTATGISTETTHKNAEETHAAHKARGVPEAVSAQTLPLSGDIMVGMVDGVP